MDVCMRLYGSVIVRVCAFESKVITPSGLSHSEQGEVARPDFLTPNLSVSSLLPFSPSCHFPLSLSLPLLSSKRAYEIAEVTFSLVNQNHAY